MADFDKQNTQDKVIAIIAEKLALPKHDVRPEATLQDLGADSLDLVEIIMKIEEAFGIEIDDEKAEHLKDVQDVIDYVHLIRTK